MVLEIIVASHMKLSLKLQEAVFHPSELLNTVRARAKRYHLGFLSPYLQLRDRDCARPSFRSKMAAPIRKSGNYVPILKAKPIWGLKVSPRVVLTKSRYGSINVRFDLHYCSKQNERVLWLSPRRHLDDTRVTSSYIIQWYIKSHRKDRVLVKYKANPIRMNKIKKKEPLLH